MNGIAYDLPCAFAALAIPSRAPSLQQSEYEATDPTEGEHCMQQHNHPGMRLAPQTIAQKNESAQSGENENGDTELNHSAADRDCYQQSQHERRHGENSVPERESGPGFGTTENADRHDQPADHGVGK
jgi:hypothetical protein